MIRDSGLLFWATLFVAHCRPRSNVTVWISSRFLDLELRCYHWHLVGYYYLRFLSTMLIADILYNTVSPTVAQGYM